MKPTNANNTTGILCMDADGSFFFRVYDKIRKEEFRDYQIKHSDLQITIHDMDAYFYDYVLDYSPETLGYNDDELTKNRK